MTPWAFKGQVSGRDMGYWLQENERPRGNLVSQSRVFLQLNGTFIWSWSMMIFH
jgi:hypothetical protein